MRPPLRGRSQGPLGPVSLEHAADITFPTTPEVAATFLALGLNIVNVVELLVLTPLLQAPARRACCSALLSCGLPAALLAQTHAHAAHAKP